MKASQSPRSTYQKFTTALGAKPGNFCKLTLERGLDFGAKAYVPKVYIKGLPGNTAFIESGTVMGPKIVSKITLGEW